MNPLFLSILRYLTLNSYALRDNILLTQSVNGEDESMIDYSLNNNKEAKDILIELRESTGMNRNQFCEYFDIPYMTVSDWEHGKKRVPKYFLRLLEYYVKTEQVKKEKENEQAM